jgi:dTDP-4-dehydrorhamnose 3,5-epimerase
LAFNFGYLLVLSTFLILKTFFRKRRWILPFKFEPTEIPTVLKVLPSVFPDNRGSFLELFKEKDFGSLNFQIRQINMSNSKKGVLRGLHFQCHPKAQAKLVFCVKGSILDVVVDYNVFPEETPKHIKVVLSESNKTGLFIPQGMAHGFLALEDDTTIVYACDNEYNSALDSGIRYDSFNIDWGIKNPIVSQKDLNLLHMR